MWSHTFNVKLLLLLYLFDSYHVPFSTTELRIGIYIKKIMRANSLLCRFISILDLRKALRVLGFRIKRNDVYEIARDVGIERLGWVEAVCFALKLDDFVNSNQDTNFLMHPCVSGRQDICHLLAISLHQEKKNHRFKLLSFFFFISYAQVIGDLMRCR